MNPEGHWESIPKYPGDFEIKGKHCRFIIAPRPPYCDRGRWQVWIDVLRPDLLHVDEADGWSTPRYFFDLTRCQLEIEAWLKARDEFIPKGKEQHA